MRADAGCDAVADALASNAHASRLDDIALESHLRSCLRCQAERTRYRRMFRALAGLADPPAPVRTDDLDRFLSTLHTRIDDQVARRRGRRRAAYLSGVAAATAGAAAAGAVVIGRRLAGAVS